MVMEYLENIVQLVLILAALLVSLFRYVSSKKRGWLYTAGFFTSSLLSCYFWTAYLVIMGDTPNASDLLTYFGWNVAYPVMALLNIHMKTKEERRYFHPLILLPIPLNGAQLLLYLQFGGAVNSTYQVAVCTFISCSCLQSLLWYAKQRKNGARPPHVAAVVLINMISEFGMWTASCYEGLADYVYYLFSFLCSGSYLLLLWAVRRAYAEESSAEETYISRRIQRFLKASYMAIAAVCSLGGIILGSWIRNVLMRGSYGEDAEGPYDIISVILFLISLILAAVAVAVILITFFEQKIFENNRLREEKLVAERSNAAKSDFLANMSHEIRTPLNAVLGMNKMIVLESSEACARLPEDREEIRRVLTDITGYAGNIESAGNNLLSIINDILDFSKIEAGRLDITEHGYQLSTVLHDVCNTIRLRAEDKGLAFRTEVSGEIPDHLCGDDMRLRQILCNLLNNAVKYTDKGSITLTVYSEGGTQPDETAELVAAVRDTGIGIREEDLGKIFDKFERTDLDRNSSVEGTGLGLAITHHLLAMMGGSIRVESEYGAGSVFTFRLPQKILSAEPIGDLDEREAAAAALHTPELRFRAPEARILIVDDTRLNLAVAAGLLKDTQIRTETAESGREALELCSKCRYDLILLDQRMPGMDGTETLRRLRMQEEGSGQRTPVICLTADALAGAKEHYLAEGFSDYLSKPIDSRALKQLLLQYLPQEKILPADKPSAEVPDVQEDPLYGALQQAGINTAANGIR